MILSSKTHLFGIIADPVDHLSAPQRFQTLFAEWQYDGLMVALHVGPSDLSAFLLAARRLRNLKGLVVTVPHKVTALDLLDSITETARMVGAVNVISRHDDGSLHGDQMDGLGFVEGLNSKGYNVAGRSVFITGAGGASAGIGFALAGAGAARITIYNRTLQRAGTLCERIARFYPHCRVSTGTRNPSGHDIVVNATTLGIHEDDPMPFDCSGLHPSMLAADVIAQPKETPFLRAAAQAGCSIFHGEEMIKPQMAQLAKFMGANDTREP